MTLTHHRRQRGRLARFLANIDFFVSQARVIDGTRLNGANHQRSRADGNQQRADERTVLAGQLHHQNDGGYWTLSGARDDQRPLRLTWQN